MLIKTPSRREFLKYSGVGAGAVAFMAGTRNAKGQVRIPGPGGQGPAAGSSFSLISHSFVAGNGNQTTPAINTVGATLLVVGVTTAGGSATTSEISDSVGGMSNTFIGPSVVASFVATNSCEGTILLVPNPTHTGASHTVTFTGSGSFETVFFAAFSGGHTIAYQGNWVIGTTYNQYDIVNDSGVSHLFISLIGSNVGNTPNTHPADWAEIDAQGTSGASPVSASGSLTGQQNNGLFLSIVLDSNNNAVSIANPTGFTITDSSLGMGGVNVGGALAFQAQSTPSATNPSWSLPSGTALGVFNYVL